MRILFIENRYATLLWQKAAIKLASDGHEIHWIVQNHGFRSSLKSAGIVHVLPYPQRKDLTPGITDSKLQLIANTDRGIRFFGGNSDHYSYYNQKIRELLTDIQPDLVFGEATQFHELMAVKNCKKLGIRYISPNATRYPAGRLVFWDSDTFDPVGGCGEILSDAAAERMLIEISGRVIQPSYMAPSQSGKLISIWRLYEQMRLLIAWFSGERFITPSPMRKIGLARSHKKAVQAWEDLALSRKALVECKRLSSSQAWVLYPLQLQPESNLDVYGQPWVNQVEILERAASALRRIGARLFVKPNPKSKYEMSNEIVSAAKRNENCIPLPHSLMMKDIFPQAPLVLSVTGTVILESVFASKPICVLGSHGLEKLNGVMSIDEPEQVANKLKLVMQKEAIVASRSEALRLLKELHARSYDALLWDPIAYPHYQTDRELEKLGAAFGDVVRFIQQKSIQ